MELEAGIGAISGPVKEPGGSAPPQPHARVALARAGTDGGFAGHPPDGYLEAGKRGGAPPTRPCFKLGEDSTMPLEVPGR